jgi:hypothetical protein
MAKAKKFKGTSFNFGANRKPSKPRKKQGKREWKGREYGS